MILRFVTDADRVLQKNLALGGKPLQVMGVESDMSCDHSCAIIATGFQK